MLPDDDEQRAGARNLLINCAGVTSGDNVLVVREEFGLGYYDEAVADRVEEEARSLGAVVHSLRAPQINGPEDFPAIVTGAMQHADHTIFFTRLADFMRFVSLPGTGTMPDDADDFGGGDVEVDAIDGGNGLFAQFELLAEITGSNK